MFGLFYDLSFYSHFDGHLSDPIYFYESGAREVSEEDFNLLKSLIEKYKEQGNDDDGTLFKATSKLSFDAPEDFWNAYNFFKHFTICKDDTIEWVYLGSEDQSELTNDSTVEIYLSTKSQIESVKTVDSRWD